VLGLERSLRERRAPQWLQALPTIGDASPQAPAVLKDQPIVSHRVERGGTMPAPREPLLERFAECLPCEALPPGDVPHPGSSASDVMTDIIKNGTRAVRDGKECVYYDGYWIRWYQPPDDTLGARRDLIMQLTRRAFHHTEAGINTPGERLEQARLAHEEQDDPALKRVNAAMLAGALFNRATDIFTSIVNLAEKGVEIRPTNELLRRCGNCFKEALELGKQVRHYSGEEGIDELWGEPLKAFTLPVKTFYESRYIKIAQTMRDIDSVVEALCDVLQGDEGFAEIRQPIRDFAGAARREAETMKSDDAIFDIWPQFVAASERLKAFRPVGYENSRVLAQEYRMGELLRLIRSGTSLIMNVAGARVPMPKSTGNFIEACKRVNASDAPRLVSAS
jgi:hypothetical protein